MTPPIGSRGRSAHGAAGRRRDTSGGDGGGGGGGGGGGVEDDPIMEGDLLFSSQMDSQAEIDRFHIHTGTSHHNILSDPSGENRDVTAIWCPQDDVVSSSVVWGPDENRDSGQTGENHPDAVYARYHMLYPDGVAMDDPDGHGTKVPGISGLYEDGVASGGTAADGRSWSARMYARSNAGDVDANYYSLYYYVYDVANSSTGALYKWDGTYPVGEWLEITEYVQMNTPGESDGILRGWVDGNQVYEKTDWQFRSADWPNVGITRAYAAYIYWGGSWGTPTDRYMYFKDFSVTDATSV